MRIGLSSKFTRIRSHVSKRNGQTAGSFFGHFRSFGDKSINNSVNLEVFDIEISNFVCILLTMEDTSPNVMLEVTIPKNSVAGDRITVQCPDHNFVEFVTPNNVAPGDTVHVMVASEQPVSTETTVVQKEKSSGSYQGAAVVTTVR